MSAEGLLEGARPLGGQFRRAAAVAFAGALVLALAGCGGESHSDLRAWMGEQGKGARGKVAFAIRFHLGDQTILDGVDLSIAPGERLSLVGRNRNRREVLLPPRSTPVFPRTLVHTPG